MKQSSMNPDRLQQVYELYHAALERPPAERAEFLSQVDPELKREVESLLAEQADGPLNRPVWELADFTVTQLAAGTELGPYRIEASIGAGGMGQVFRAVDTRLGRKVALKTCHEQFIARFEREARAISALNHSNICTLFDIGPNYLVMELCDGETLAERLKRGTLSIQETIRYGAQIADALSAAHAKAIVHRDLKPGNVMLTKAGVKVLDFGLSKSSEDETLTASRMVMGTPAYMPPEQREGKKCDARTDIFALGLVLYEMAAGKRLVQGQAPLIEGLPASLAHVIERCLAKDPEDRWQSARDLKAELEWSAGRGTEIPRQAEASPTKLLWAVAGILMAALTIAGVGWWRAMRPVTGPLMRFNVDLGTEGAEGLSITPAISPEGTRLAYAVRGIGGKRQLATRLLDQAQATMLAGTEDASAPFFSPDGQWIGFFADGKMKKISVQGGAPVTLCDAVSSRGANWGEDGSIIAALSANGGLSLIPTAGGAPRVITNPGEIGETSHRWPQMLPGGQAVLFTGARAQGAYEDASIEVLSLKTGQWKSVQRGGYFGRYVPSGHLVYIHQGTLFAVRFDLNHLEVHGLPVPLLEDVAGNSSTGQGNYDVARNGTLVYLSGKSFTSNWPVTWMDSAGKTQPLQATSDQYYTPRLSPDGNRLVLSKGLGSPGTELEFAL